jgi:hypothetical protein
VSKTLLELKAVSRVENSQGRPIVFFSHSARDARVLGALKDIFCRRTCGVFDVFLSSDGESIPFGTTWSHRIEEAMRSCSLMFVFVSEQALGAKWIYFESGWACALGTKVIPVAMPGVMLGALGPPLSNLQGFNLHSKDGLENLIATANQQLGSEFDVAFSNEDFGSLGFAETNGARRVFGEITPFINDVSLEMLVTPATDAAERDLDREVGEILRASSIPFRFTNDFHCNGFLVSVVHEKPEWVDIKVDPWAIESKFLLCATVLAQIDGTALRRCLVCVRFNSQIEAVPDDFRLAARLSDFQAEIDTDDGVVVGDVRVRTVNETRRNPSQSGLPFSPGLIRTREHVGCELWIRSAGRMDISLEQVSQMVQLFWERGLLFLRDH